MDFDKVNKYMNILQDKYHPIMMFLYGSQNYSMDTETSDYDFNIIVKDSFEDLYYLRNGKAEDFDFIVDKEVVGKVNVIPLRLFLKGLRKGSITYYENFYSKVSQFNENSHVFANNDFKHELTICFYDELLYSMIGYTYSYIEKYNKTKDMKTAANLLRVKYMIENFCELPHILEFDMKKLGKSDFLKKVKTNNLNEEEKELLQKELDGLEIFLEEKKKSLSDNDKEWEYCDMLFEERKENCEKKLFDLFIKLNGFEGR